MFLKKIEIIGFKSFPHKTVLEFDKGIATIVGPNGSGKSNIADAVRWAMGEQSLKLIRSKRSEDVIFSGSGKKASSGFARVSLYLDNSSSRLGIEWEEIVITRKIFRSGESEYLINKTPVRLMDIVELLAKAGISQRGYCVISQGMTDSILSASAGDRRSILEEAAGIKPYQIKKQIALRKLERAEENLIRLEDLINEISPRLRSLKRQVVRAAKRQIVENQLKELQRQWFGYLLAKLNSQKQQKIQQKQNLILEINKLERIRDEANAQLEKFKNLKRFGENEKFSSQLESLEEKARALQKELMLVEAKIEIRKEKQKNLESIHSIPIDLDYIQKKLSNISESYNKIMGQYEELIAKSLFSEFKSVLEAFGSELENLLKEARQGKIILKKSQNQKPYEGEVQNLIAKKDELKKQIETLEISIRNLRSQIKKVYEEEKSQRLEFFNIQKVFLEKEQQISRIKEAKQIIEIEEAKIDAHLEDLSREIQNELGFEEYQNIDQKNKNPTNESDFVTINEEELKSHIEKLKAQLIAIGSIDPATTVEYEETSKRYEFLRDQANDLKQSSENLKKIIKELEQKIEVDFNQAFKNIDREFNKYFRIIFGGGMAGLQQVSFEKEESPQITVENNSEENKEIINPHTLPRGIRPTQQGLDNFSKPVQQAKGYFKGVGIKEELSKEKRSKTLGYHEKGIEIKVTLPGKKIRDLNVLSGGERALTAIALLFAIINNNPPPFSVLDEIDAALDEANSKRIGSILDQLANHTQFIIITHNREIMRHASILYGVTIEDSCVSKLLSVKLDEVKES